MENEDKGMIKFILMIVSIVLFILFLGMAGCPRYNVWSAGMEGKAQLMKATQNRQIKIQEAKAKEESAKYLAQAEVARARGVAKANLIIGESLKNNESYLRYLWIHNLEEGKGHQIIYVPTEANLPILEAGRRK